MSLADDSEEMASQYPLRDFQIPQLSSDSSSSDSDYKLQPQNVNHNEQPPFPYLPTPINFSTLARHADYSDYIQRRCGNQVQLASLTSPGIFTVPDPAIKPDNLPAPVLAHVVRQQVRDKIVVEAKDSWIRNIFSDQVLPGAFSQDRYSQDRKWWRSHTETFKTLSFGSTESDLRNTLNSMTRYLGGLFGQSTGNVRIWEDRTSRLPPAGGSFKRKPDLVLLNENFIKNLKPRAHVPWRHVQALCEVTKRPPTDTVRYRVFTTILEKSLLLFERQPARRFIFALAFFGEGADMRWNLYLIDRSGAVISELCNTVSSSAHTLVRIIYALAFGASELLGTDNSMEVDKDGLISRINIMHTEDDAFKNSQPAMISYKPIQLLHNPRELVGRGTRVWVVEGIADDRYVLKDSWVQSSQTDSEIDFLKTLRDHIVPGSIAHKILRFCYPELIAGQEIGDSTNLHRKEIGPKPPARVHRRIITRSIGDALTTFRSKYELVKVMIDVVNYLEFCSKSPKILHSDISLNNIRIARVPAEEIEDVNLTDEDIDRFFEELGKTKTVEDVNDHDDDVNSLFQSTSTIQTGRDAGSSMDATSHISGNVDESAISCEPAPSSVPSSISVPSDPPLLASPQEPSPEISDNANNGDVGASGNAGAVVNTETNGGASTGGRGSVPLKLPYDSIRAFGLVIDNDYSKKLGADGKSTSTLASGTIPFMPIDVLAGKLHVAQHPGHDLESLVYVLMSLCMYTTGPCQLRTTIPDTQSIPLGRWFNQSNLHQLAREKCSILQEFDTYIAGRVTSYWDDFMPFLSQLLMACFKHPDRPMLGNAASHVKFRAILRTALKHYEMSEETPVPYPYDPPRPEKRGVEDQDGDNNQAEQPSKEKRPRLNNTKKASQTGRKK